jgi:hypothetical protein
MGRDAYRMSEPTPEQQKILQDIAKRVPPPRPNRILKTKRGDIEVSNAEMQQLQNISQTTGQSLSDLINAYL